MTEGLEGERVINRTEEVYIWRLGFEIRRR
jgi:hypothetical protein